MWLLAQGVLMLTSGHGAHTSCTSVRQVILVMVVGNFAEGTAVRRNNGRCQRLRPHRAQPWASRRCAESRRGTNARGGRPQCPGPAPASEIGLRMIYGISCIVESDGRRTLTLIRAALSADAGVDRCPANSSFPMVFCVYIYIYAQRDLLLAPSLSVATGCSCFQLGAARSVREVVQRQ
jgi:hypothetical protein